MNACKDESPFKEPMEDTIMSSILNLLRKGHFASSEQEEICHSFSPYLSFLFNQMTTVHLRWRTNHQHWVL